MLCACVCIALCSCRGVKASRGSHLTLPDETPKSASDDAETKMIVEVNMALTPLTLALTPLTLART